jgi:hypothetical protein
MMQATIRTNFFHFQGSFSKAWITPNFQAVSSTFILFQSRLLYSQTGFGARSNDRMQSSFRRSSKATFCHSRISSLMLLQYDSPGNRKEKDLPKGYKPLAFFVRAILYSAPSSSYFGLLCSGNPWAAGHGHILMHL